MAAIVSGLSMALVNGADSVLWAGGASRYLQYVQKKLGDQPALIYKNNKDERNIAVRVASRIGYQIANDYANNLIGNLKDRTEDMLRKRKGDQAVTQALSNSEKNTSMRLAQQNIENQARQRVLEQQAKNLRTLIEERQAVYGDMGTLLLPDCNYTVIAGDAYGKKVETALILSYKAENVIPVTVTKNGQTNVFNTSYRFFCDAAPTVNQSTNKDVVVTKVQGRDFSRKELVAGGDISFTVSGTINSNKDGVYPDNEVGKFIEIMQYNGVINVKHFLFSRFGIKSIIITDFKLDAPAYLNVQPYSFTCLAVEPDSEVQITEDTISAINSTIASLASDNWAKTLLAAKQESLSLGYSSAPNLLSTYLDSLI